MNENKGEKQLPEARTSPTVPSTNDSESLASTDEATAAAIDCTAKTENDSDTESTTDSKTKSATTSSSTKVATTTTSDESEEKISSDTLESSLDNGPVIRGKGKDVEKLKTENDSDTETTTDSKSKAATSSSSTKAATTATPKDSEGKSSADTSESNVDGGPVRSGKEKDVEKLSDGAASGNEGYFTIDDVVDAAGYGKFQKFLTFLAGLGWLADAFEIIILSIIGDMLACDWVITRWQNALLTSIVFFGMTFGAPCFGNFADRYGRRMSLAISMLFLFIFGAASAASPSYVWMIVLRGLMGFSLGGIAQGVTLCCEYYPAKLRGRAGFYLSYYWSIGTLGVVLAAWIVMHYLDNWRVFVFVAAIPALIVFLVMKWYPESARYYLVSDQYDKAIDVLERLVRMNKSEMPAGQLLMTDAVEQRGRITDLLKPTLRRSTLQFWYIWWTVAMMYYGIALLTPLIVTHGSLMELSRKQGNRTFLEDFTALVPCKKFSDENFLELLWTSAAEFPGLLFFTFAVECCSRKIFLGTTIFINAFLILFLTLEIKPRIALLLILFVSRAIVAGVFQLLFIMTAEAFPTTLRASAMGTGSGWARIGGLIVPIVAQVVVISRPVAAICTLFVLGLLAGAMALLLPMDTRGKHMLEVVEQY